MSVRKVLQCGLNLIFLELIIAWQGVDLQLTTEESLNVAFGDELLSTVIKILHR